MSNGIIATNVTTLDNMGALDATDFGIHNEELAEMTNDLIRYSYDARVNGLRVAAILGTIRANADKLLEEFDNSYNVFAEKVLGLKKAQANALAQMGEEFLNKDGSARIFEPEGHSYNKTQLQALLPLGRELAHELAKKGVISPTMSTQTIKQLVAENRPDAAEKAAKAEKREAAKKQKEESQKNVERAVYGDVVATFEVRMLPNGEIVVWKDGAKMEPNHKVFKYLARNYSA